MQTAPQRAPQATAAPSLPAGAVWVVIPTYNERANVRPISEAILATIPGANVLIVDDGSPDGTGDVADQLAAERPDVAVLHRTAKQGLGPAYVAGFRDVLRRGAQVVVQMDADFSHPVRFLPAVVGPAVAGDADLVIGSRYVKGGQIPRWNLLRRFVSRGGSLFAQVVLLLPFRDLTGGFNAWRATTLSAIDLDAVGAGGYVFQIEMKFRARRLGARIREVPITFEERREGASKMSGGIFLEAFARVLELRWAAMRGRIPKR